MISHLTRAQLVVVWLLAVPIVLMVATAIGRIVGPDAVSPGIYRAESLPAGIHLCDRDWKRSDIRDVRPLAEIRVRSGVEPTIVDPRPFAPCPPGPCNAVAGGPCDTVIYVRVAEDGYVAYELRGGP